MPPDLSATLHAAQVHRINSCTAKDWSLCHAVPMPDLPGREHGQQGGVALAALLQEG